MTKHLLVTDHYLSHDEITSISELIKAGGEVDFPEETLKAAWVDSAAMERGVKRSGIGCIIVLVIVIVAAGLAIAARIFTN